VHYYRASYNTRMTLLLDIPATPASPLHRIDPRWKLAGLLGAAVAIAFLQSSLAACAAMGAALIVAGIARLPGRWFAERLGAALVLPAFFALWLPFVARPGDSVYEGLGIAISVTGVERAAALIAKAAAIVSLVLVLLATAPLQDTFKAAQALWIPGWLVHLALLSYRYLHLLGEEFVRLRIALRVRGYRNRARVHSYRTIGQVAGTLLVRGYERSERVAQAMRSRAFDGRFRTLHGYRTQAADVFFFASSLLAAGTLLAWDLWIRW